VHGHRWEVRVTVSGGLDPKKGFVVDHGELAADVGAITAEFADRFLNVMLPGVLPTPEGLASYYHERLVLKWVRIVAIEVDMGPLVTTRTEWDVR
jgi:6-pyruvoyl-tetrahydropterin synthase